MVEPVTTALCVYPLDEAVCALGSGIREGTIFVEISEDFLVPLLGCTVEPCQFLEEGCLNMVFCLPFSYLFFPGRWDEFLPLGVQRFSLLTGFSFLIDSLKTLFD